MPTGGGRARLELARRYLHVYGPTTAASFAVWSGLGPRAAAAVVEALRPSLVPVETPVGGAFALEPDEAELRRAPGPPAPARLLPSGDAYFLLQGADRELLVPDPEQRATLWTSRVWPGALLVGGVLAGTWRRSGADMTVAPWRRLSAGERAEVEREARALPLPGLDKEVGVRFES